MTEVESLEQWHPLDEMLHNHGYRLWQWQYNTKHPEGFHAWFWVTDRPDVEIVTHNDDVCWEIIQFNRKK